MCFATALTAAALVLLIGAGAVAEGVQEQRTWLWVGGGYYDRTDYERKVGEYTPLSIEGSPELGFGHFARYDQGFVRVKGMFEDQDNIFGLLEGKIGDKFSGSIRYRSMVRNMGQDLLENMNAREYFPATETFGGKTITHELHDPGAEYEYTRHEVLSEFEALISRKHNVKVTANHRSLLFQGEEQYISNSHCFSCHMQSQTRGVDRATHSLEVGLQADVATDFTVGYQLGYRLFSSSADQLYATYDSARHPANNAFAHEEFDARQAFADTTLAVGVLPETEKISHKIRATGKVGQGRLAGSFIISTTENKNTSVKTDGMMGAVAYSVPLSPKTRLRAKASFKQIQSDDPFSDLPDFRGTRTWPEPWVNRDFDGYKYSSLDRTVMDGSAEVIHKLAPKWTVSGLLGYEQVDRDDYPAMGDGLSTGTFTGQLQAIYRKGLRYSSRIKYRTEMTTDPFVAGRGLFEEPMKTAVDPRTFQFIFYFEREDYRYQNITTAPTDLHEIDWRSTWRPDPKVNLSLGFKFKYEKNGDLDSLDVERTMMQPHLNLTVTPDPKWALTGGYSMNVLNSRGPVTIALFDG